MMKRWLSSPILAEGPELEKQVRLLSNILVLVTLVVVLTGVLFWEQILLVPMRLWLILAITLINLVSWGILRRAGMNLAGKFMVAGYWACATILVSISGGVESPWLIAQLSLTVFAGLLAGIWGGVFIASLSLATDLSIQYLAQSDLIALLTYEPTVIEVWLALFVNLVFMGYVIGAARETAKESLDRARMEEKLYRSLFEKTNDAVFIIDMNQVYLDVNQQAADLLGYTIDELIGMPVERVIVPEERNSSQEKIRSLGQNAVIPVYERRVVCKDGSRKTVEVNLALVTDDKGKPLHYQSIVRDVSERKRLEQQLKDSLSEMQEIAMRDSLTGLLNRRAIMEYAESEWHRSRREARPMCVMLIDLDNLKTINDEFGHFAGDQALLGLVEAINTSKRHYDWTGRWGGDEFLMVLPSTNLVEAEEVANRLRMIFKESDLVKGNGNQVALHVSLGVACFSGREEDDTSLQKLLAQADQALYEAKESGRDRVGVYRDGTP